MKKIIGGFCLLVVVGFALISIHQPGVASVTLPTPALKDLSTARGIQVGNFAILNHLQDKPYTDILNSQFNFALADNTPNWYFTDGGLRPSATTYNFKQMDQVIDYVEANNLPVQAHHLVWGEQKWLPDWLKNGNYSPNQLMQIMHDHIMTVGQHYSGKIREWAVVNEPFTRAEHLFGLSDWWADHTGGQAYMDQAFKWARQADPHAKLLLNDFNNEAINDTSNDMYNYVKAAKARGVPIDGVGLQMHIDGTHPPTKDEVISNMRRFAALGVDVYVTEFDVNMHDLKASNKTKDAVEGNIYYEMMRACIESNVCHSFAVLGVTDAETWYNYLPGVSDARPLPFDKNYQPKPAFYSLRTALIQP